MPWAEFMQSSQIRANSNAFNSMPRFLTNPATKNTTRSSPSEESLVKICQQLSCPI